MIGSDILKITIHQDVLYKPNQICTGIHKTFDSNIIPHIGDSIQDNLWKDPSDCEVKKVIIDYADNSCFVIVGLMMADTEKSAIDYVNLAMKYRNWECPNWE